MAELLGSGPVQGVVRLALLCGLLLLVGAEVALARLVPPAPDAGDAWRDGARARVRRIERRCVVMLVIVVIARLIQQGAAFADTPDQWPTSVPLILQHTTWGTGWLVQVLSLAIVWLAAPGERGGRLLARRIALAALVLTPALSGHAIGAPRLTIVAVVMDAAHVAAAGAWVGTLAVMAMALAPMRQSVPAREIHTMLVRFSPMALASAAMVAASGTFASWLHLETLAALWSTPYGRALALKLALTAGIAAAGAVNWRVATPRLATSGDRAMLLRAVAVELAVAVALLVVTSILIVTPLPSEG